MRLEHCTDNFISIIQGKPTSLFLIRNARNSVAAFTNFGARWVGMELQKQSGYIDPVCGFDSIEPYRGPGDAYYGAIVGRFANRIDKGKFELDGKEYTLAVNNGQNHLHGGPDGLHQVVWNVESYNKNEIIFSYTSPDGEGGYPGELSVEVIYNLSDEDELRITISAITSNTTIVNLTNHAYFNLSGGGSIEDHLVSIEADHFIPVKEDLIPTGEIRKVVMPFDLRQEKRIGDGFLSNNDQLKYGNGYDHCFVLNGEGMRKVASVRYKNLQMECITDQPGLQFYSGNFMNGSNIFRQGSTDNFRSAFCLEMQKFPDSPNQPSFPSAVLLPGEKYQNNSIYKFRHL